MTDPVALYTKLTAAFNRGDWRQARDLAAQLLPYAPRHVGVYYIAGIAHMELQQMPLAVEYLRRAEILEPRRIDIVTQYAKALSLVHRNRDAKAAADRALALPPNDPPMLDTLGVIYTMIGDYGTASTRHSLQPSPTAFQHR